MRKTISLILALALCVGLAIPAMAASDKAIAAADKLHELGLFNGVGNNADGTPNYDLDRAPTRAEAVTLLVRLLGKEAEALAGSWTIPFTDVADWAKPYVGYAYANGLTSGTSATTFSGTDTVSATQYLTFVLRALGYSSDSDFAWNAAWELTDKLGITNGEYNAASAFTRGDAVIVSANALDKELNDGSKTLLEAIEQALANVPKKSFSCSGTADLGTAKELAKITATIDVASANVAIFTIEFPFDLDEVSVYEVIFSNSNQEIAFQYWYWPGKESYNASAISKSIGESENLNAIFTETVAENGKVSWRVELPADCVFKFDMAGDYTIHCNAEAMFGG